MRVFIDGQLAVEAWESWTRGSTVFEEGCEERVGEVVLEAGRDHEVVAEFRAAPYALMDFSAYHLGIDRPLGNEAIAEAVRLASAADVAVLCVGRNGEWDTEGTDLPSMRLPGRQDELVSAVAAAAPRTVVVLQTGGPVEMPWLDEVDAVLQAWYPGQELGHAVADMLLGHAEPGGRLPQSFPRSLADSPLAGCAPGVYPAENGRIRYEEGGFIGYRHHERSGIEPLFAFGHGLGYATIDIEGVEVEAAPFEAEGRVEVRVGLANSGERSGSQVVQLYVAPVSPPVERPDSELKAFAKLRLRPGEKGEARFVLTPRDFAWYSVPRHGWVVSPGAYRILVGLSSVDRPFEREITRESEMFVEV